MKRSIVILVYILFVSIASAQTQKQWLRYADESYESKDFYGASIYYRKAMLVDSSNLLVVYQYAESLRQYNEYKLAEYYYKFVIDKDNNKDYPLAVFWYATMQKYSANYVKARTNFIRYSKNVFDKKSYYYKKTQQEIKSCEFALGLLKDTLKLNIKNIGDTLLLDKSINTINSEFNAVPLNDSTIYFSSLRSEKLRGQSEQKDSAYLLKIYEAKLSDTAWLVKNELDTTINKKSIHHANVCLTDDNKTMYFVRCNKEMKCAIYKSNFINDKWQEATKLSDSINKIGYTATQPFITKIDNDTLLFFTSDRPGTIGKLDIWKSKQENGQFITVQNLGATINTLDDDVSPVFDTINKMLYFSSPWHLGLGGFDIFSASYENNTFSSPINVGYPINSSVNDLYFTFNSKNKTGFLTSNRKGSIFRKSETCCNDIWAFKLIVPVPIDTVPKKVISPLEELMTYLPVKLYFHNDEPNPKTLDTLSTIDYLTSYNQYKELVPVYRENYALGVSEENKKIAEDTVVSFFENHVDKGVQDLEKFTALLLQELELGHKLDLLVKGHASSLAKTDYNVHLTLRRISSLDLYLRSYKNGVIIPYLEDTARNGGSLTMIRLPFGEYKAHKLLNDNLNDKKNSVYSISAALARNIEIVSVTLSHRDSLHAEMRFLKKEIFDFGSSKDGQELSHVFKFKNTGKAPLIISSTNISCACITVKASATTIAPGEKGEVEITLDTKGLSGKEVHSISIMTNGIPSEKELSVTTEVK